MIFRQIDGDSRHGRPSYRISFTIFSSCAPLSKATAASSSAAPILRDWNSPQPRG
jgi:hypothetical protein